MNWWALIQRRNQELGVCEPGVPGSADPSFHDPYAEKRRRALELLGERYVLHPAKALHRRPSGTGGARAMRSVPH